MKSSATTSNPIFSTCRIVHALVFVVAMLSFFLHASNVQAASLRPVDYRVLAAVNNFDDTWQYAVTFRMRPPRRLRSSHLELAISTNPGLDMVGLNFTYNFNEQ